MRLVSDESGSVAPLAASFVAIALLVAAGLLDVGFWFLSKRQQQSATDLAAIAAASDLTNPRNAAVATLDRNGLPSSGLGDLELGRYSPDPALPVAARFISGATPANAARVSVRRPLASLAGSFLGRSGGGLSSSGVVQTQAIAAQAQSVGFGIGSGLVQLDAGLLNATLSALLGSNVSLTLLDYQAILATKIDVLSFLDLLAVRADLGRATYADLLGRRVRVGDVLRALAEAAQAANSDARAIAALSGMAAAKAGAIEDVALGQFVTAGPYGLRYTGDGGLTGTGFGALDLVTEVLKLASTGKNLQFTLPIQLAGLISAKVQLAIGERAQTTSGFTIGQVGASAHTAQTRLLIDLVLVGLSPLASVRLPIYIELAPAQAELAEISCSAVSPDRDGIKLKVTPGVIDAWIGQVGATEFYNTKVKPSPGQATLVDVAFLLRIKALAHASLGTLTAQTLSFSRAEMQSATRKATSTTDLTSSLVRSLLGDLRLTTEVLGLGLPLEIDRTLVDTLTARLGVIDQVLATVLNLLGLKLGVAETWATGLRCSNAVLVH